MYFVRFNYFGLVSFTYVVRQVMLNVVGELLLVLRVESQYFHQALYINALEVTVSQSFNVATGLDHRVTSRAADGGPATRDGARVTRPTALAPQPHAYVTSDQIAFT